MAEFSVTVSDAEVERVTKALSKAGGFTESSEENARKAVMNFIAQTVQNVEHAEAQAQALAAVQTPTPLELS